MCSFTEPVWGQPYWAAHSAPFDKMEVALQFRLTYDGHIMGSGNGGSHSHKHDIRRVFHSQLKRHWGIYPHLDKTAQDNLLTGNGSRYIDNLADNYARFGFRFVPLIHTYGDLVGTLPIVSLDILFLRSGKPGGVLKSADIDGRLKTIFDALRMPDLKQEVGEQTPAPDEDPFYVLLADDRFIGNVSITTDTLLQPSSTSGRAAFNDNHDARLVIQVKIQSYDGGIYLP